MPWWFFYTNTGNNRNRKSLVLIAMSLSRNQKIQIKDLLSKKIESKLKSYDRETTSMPFLARLIQDSEKIAAYSFIHSMATSLVP